MLRLVDLEKLNDFKGKKSGPTKYREADLVLLFAEFTRVPAGRLSVEEP
jgi:hypothetical protein